MRNGGNHDRSWGWAAAGLTAALLLAGCDAGPKTVEAKTAAASSQALERKMASRDHAPAAAVLRRQAALSTPLRPGDPPRRLVIPPQADGDRPIIVDLYVDAPSSTIQVRSDRPMRADQRELLAVALGQDVAALSVAGVLHEPDAPYDELTPVIPWPPPIASSRADITASILGQDRGYAAIDRRLRGLLAGRGYSDLYYFSAPTGGFVIMTRAERIDARGAPLSKDRWLSTKQTASLSAGDYLHKLIFGDDGRIRLLTFVVSARDFRTEGGPATDADVQRWRSTGQPKLSARIAGAQAPRGTSVTLLVYEFQLDRKEARQLEATSAALPAAAHLASLGLGR